jgi:ribosome-binding protein aMBF1 (putative translation factor)
LGQVQPAPRLDDLVERGAAPELAYLAVVVGEARVEHGWTRQQLATASKVNHAVITAVEAADRDVSYRTVVRLCETLGISSLDVLH